MDVFTKTQYKLEILPTTTIRDLKIMLDTKGLINPKLYFNNGEMLAPAVFQTNQYDNIDFSGHAKVLNGSYLLAEQKQATLGFAPPTTFPATYHPAPLSPLGMTQMQMAHLPVPQLPYKTTPEDMKTGNYVPIGKEGFDTQDNGGYPFRVYIEKGRAEIYELEFDEDTDEHTPGNLMGAVNGGKFFVGTSPLNKMTEFSGGAGEDGSSLVLQDEKDVKDNIYTFVGTKIYKFKTLAPLIYFTSPVGNNSVPYPWAQDRDGNIYLLIEDVVIKNWAPAINKTIEEKDQLEPYTYYYNNRDFEVMNPRTNTKYKLQWTPKPEQDYDRISKYPRAYEQFPDLNLGKDVWVATIKQYGVNRFEPLNVTNVIAVRRWGLP